MKKISSIVLVLLTFFLVACAHKPAATKPRVLLLHLGANPSVLNPILSTDSASSSVIDLVFSGLFRVNTQLNLEPDLAESYTISPDGKTYLFHLRQNVRWHDGHPFTASDVVFTFQKILDNKTNTVRRSDYVIDGIPVTFEALDPHTVKATLPKPFAPFLSNMTMGIVPEHLLKNSDINTADFNRHPIGTGPFIFEKWESAQYVALHRFDGFYLKKPKLDKILMKIIPNDATALMAFEKGELDEVGVPAKDIPRFEKRAGSTFYRYQTLNYTYLGFNLKTPLFSQLKVRQALAHAVDKQALVNSVLKGYGLPAELPCSPVSWAYPKNNTPLGYSPEKSRQLLQASGFVLNKKSGLFEKNGLPLEFTVLTNKGNLDREKTCEILQQYFLKVGVKMNIQVMEWSSLLKILQAPQSPKKFDAVILGWSLGIDPDSYAIWHSKEYPQGFNIIGYHNPTVDSLLEKGRKETHQEARRALYNRLYNTIAEDIPYLFLFYPEATVSVQNRVKGLSKPGPAGLMNKIEDVYIQ